MSVVRGKVIVVRKKGQLMSGIAWRKWTCNGCGYSQIGTDTYYKMKKGWDTTHTLAFCKARKIEMFPGTMDSLAKLSIMS
jgi:hypothetical protein